MNNIVLSEPPPNLDSFAPEFCFCGKKTVSFHDFMFCSTRCARMDSLRSLDDPECHYRNTVRKAYIQAGVPELYPRRMVSVDQLRPTPSERRGIANASPHHIPPTSPTQRRNETTPRRDVQGRNLPGFPALSQATGNVLTRSATAREPVVPGRHNQPRREGPPNPSSRAHRAQGPEDLAFRQLCLDTIPLPEPAPARTLRRAPQSTEGLRNNIRKSVAALLNVGRSRKDNASESSERVFGHPVNTIVPPVRKESLHWNRHGGPPPANSATSSRALRRSASFAGWDPVNGKDPVMHIIDEMREELAESFDPRSFFEREEPY